MPMQYSIVWRFTGRVLPWYFSRAFQSLLKYFSLPSSELLHSSFTKAMGYVIGASESPLEVFESEYAAFGSPRLRLNSRVACQVKNCVWENFKGSASLEWLSIAGLKPQGRLQISVDSWDRLVCNSDQNWQGSTSGEPAVMLFFITTSRHTTLHTHSGELKRKQGCRRNFWESKQMRYNSLQMLGGKWDSQYRLHGKSAAREAPLFFLLLLRPLESLCFSKGSCHVLTACCCCKAGGQQE